MALTITSEQYAIAQFYVSTGDYEGGWAYLASIGDNYADNAYAVTSGNSTNVIDQGFQILVEQHWANTAGPDAYAEKFNQVAQQHFKQYVGLIGEDENYALPTSEQIEQSYRAAVTKYDLPPETAFDGVFTNTIGELADAFWPGPKEGGLDWTDFLGMEGDRQVGSDVFNDLDKLESWETLLKDIWGTPQELAERGLDEAAEQWNQILDDSIQAVNNFLRDAFNWAKNLSDALNQLTSYIQSLFGNAESNSSPLILDLDGDGVETLSKTLGVHFDHDVNGFAETTGWAHSDDGFLAYDRNSNGQIDNGTELFGNNTLLQDGTKAANGFEALAELDDNGDNLIDANDAAYEMLRIWQDQNSDGIVQDGELKTLSQVGVTSIGTAYGEQVVIDANGNQHLQTGSYLTSDNLTREVTDVWFATDLARTVNNIQVEISDEISQLPNLIGFGNVMNLHQAMAMDESETLKTLVQELIADLGSNELNTETIFTHVDALLLAWSGADQFSETSRGNYVNGQHLYAVEAFLGEGFLQQGYMTDPRVNAGGLLEQAYQALLDYTVSDFLKQTLFKPVFDNIHLSWDNNGQMFSFELSDAVQNLKNLYENTPGSGLLLLTAFAKTLAQENMGEELLEHFQAAGNSQAQGFDFYLSQLINFPDNTQLGTGEGDTLNGTSGVSNIIHGLAGDDTINGSTQNDILSGGAGDDELDGGKGNDTYIFNLGDGHDRIDEYDSTTGNTDLLKLGAGITTDNTQLARVNNGRDLLLTFDGDDSVLIDDYFYGSNYRVERIEFSDGVDWDYAAVVNQLNYTGTSGNDTLNGLYGVENRIDGLAGDDTINGSTQNDTLTGGAGDDELDGGKGNDTYIFNLGDGHDRIDEYDSTTGNTDLLKLGAGITTDNTQLARVNNGRDLLLTFDGHDSVLIDDYFYGSNYRVERIEFSDGVDWDYAAVVNQLNYTGTSGNDTLNGLYGVENRIDGLAGDDTINGSTQNDTLTGGAGDDELDGGKGNDTYIFNLGDGHDRIDEYDSTTGNTDILKLGAGITTDNTQLARVNNGRDLLLTFDGDNSVLIDDYFYGSNYRVERIEFSDGVDWDYAAVVNQLNYTGTSGNDTLNGLYGVENRIDGLAGDDTINGSTQNDTLTGGAGDDELDGGKGNDTYIFNLGDGHDRIDEYDSTTGNTDLLKLGAGITTDNTQLARVNNGRDLLLNFDDHDSVLIDDYFYGSNYRVERIEFSDGVDWDYAAVVNQLNYTGTSGNDTLNGLYGVENRIDGLAGDDTINGSTQNDTLTGGAGDDELDGGKGNDTYIFNLGDGHDRIDEYDSTTGNTDILKLGAGITTDNTQLARVNNGRDLLLTFDGDNSVLIDDYFYGSNYRVERIEFSDGVDWDYAAVVNQLNYTGTSGNDTLNGLYGVENRIDGLAGDDTINGSTQNDTLTGGAGDDELDGGKGNDTYIFNLGDGHDRIDEYDSTTGNTDILKLGAGITTDNTQLARVNNGRDLLLTFDGDNSVLIDDYFYGSNYRVERIEFSDGSYWNYATIMDIAEYHGTEGNDSLYGMSGINNHIKGFSGDDKLTGHDGADHLEGGFGSDELDGGAGNDLIDGGLGQDILIGNEGADEFYFDSLDDNSAAEVDKVADFQQGIDKIDLSQLDAVFADLTFDAQADGTMIGIEGEDFAIKVVGQNSLAESDFIMQA